MSRKITVLFIMLLLAATLFVVPSACGENDTDLSGSGDSSVQDGGEVSDDGEQGANGEQITDGEQGANGEQITDGEQGANGEQITDGEQDADKGDGEMTVNPKVIITMADGKTIKLELFPEIAPISVANFLKLVDGAYYDGLIFHRIIESFIIQSGGYRLDGSTLYRATETATIKGEFSENGVNNTLSHDAGVISMARTTVKDSATGQFFICTNGNNKLSLDGKYAAFGRTVDAESLNNVLAIASVDTVTLTNLGMANFPYPDVPTIATIRRLAE